MEDQMAAWMAVADPTEEHEFLKQLEGSWKAQVKIWMQPGAPPMESQGISQNEMILGGRYLRSTCTISMPMGEFGGLALDAYDRVAKKYRGIWVDSMGTGIMVFEGGITSNVRTMLCESLDPSGRPFTTKGVTTIVNDNEHRYESFLQTPEGEFRNMEIIYTRS